MRTSTAIASYHTSTRLIELYFTWEYFCVWFRAWYSLFTVILLLLLYSTVLLKYEYLV